jgi:hypothetical protein
MKSPLASEAEVAGEADGAPPLAPLLVWAHTNGPADSNDTNPRATMLVPVVM